MKRIKAGLKFTPDPTDSYLQAKPYLKVSIFGTRKKPQQPTGSRGPSWDGMVAKAGNQADKAHRKLLEASGTRYEVKIRGDRDKHVRSFKSQAEAQRFADKRGGFVHDHYEGRDIYWSPAHLKRWRPKDHNAVPDSQQPSEDHGDSWEVSA